MGWAYMRARRVCALRTRGPAMSAHEDVDLHEGVCSIHAAQRRRRSVARPSWVHHSDAGAQSAAATSPQPTLPAGWTNRGESSIGLFEEDRCLHAGSVMLGGRDWTYQSRQRDDVGVSAVRCYSPESVRVRYDQFSAWSAPVEEIQRMRTLLIVNAGQRSQRWSRAFEDAIEQRFDADIVQFEDEWPDCTGYDIVLSRVKSRRLFQLDSLGWRGFSGLRVHIDEDTCQDSHWTHSNHVGAWRRAIPRLGFELLVTTGQRPNESFREAGLATILVHKGFDPEQFSDLDGARGDGLLAYGADYPSRILARASLQRRGVQVVRKTIPYSDLGKELNLHLWALVGTMDADIVGGRIGKKLMTRFPRLLIRPRPGPEPMLKLFESAASGCAPVVDWTPDLAGLGFIDGDTAITYRDVTELVEKALGYAERPSQLRAIGQRAAILSKSRHTWDHRALQLHRLITMELNGGAVSSGDDSPLYG